MEDFLTPFEPEKDIGLDRECRDFFGLSEKEEYKKTAVDYSEKVDMGELGMLNEKQREMVVGINNFLSNGDAPFYTVQGGAGVGKTTAIYSSIRHIGPGNIIFATPSHFAKNILLESLDSEYTVRTIASLMAKKIAYSKEGDQILIPIPRKKPPLLSFSILVIDEGSMVDDDMAREILRLCKRNFIKVIVIGDVAQLPPVNQENDSFFFDSPDIVLTEPMRFTGPIYDLSMLIRIEIMKIRSGLVPNFNVINTDINRVSNIIESGTGYIFLSRLDTLLKAAIKRFKLGKDASYVRVVAYRNKTIDKLNYRIRKALYGDNPKQFEPGEVVINSGGYSGGGNKDTAAIINNGEVFIVDTSTELIGPYDIPCQQLWFQEKSFDKAIITVSDKGKEVYQKTLARYKKEALQSGNWVAFSRFKESFAYFNYAYATSTHKVQGSSIKYVFIIEEDILDVRMTSVKEKLQSLYVAITRASFRVYLYHSKFKADNSKLLKEHLLKDFDDGV